MKPARFDYARAGDVADAIRLLGSSDGFNKPLGGGMSLGPMMNLRLAQPDLVVEVRKLDALKAVAEEGDSLVVGAGITHAEIEDGKIPDTTNGMMRFVAGQIAYRAVRNRGTVGGSIAHADPAADWPTALRALGAEVAIDGPDGARVVALSDFQLAAFTVALEPADIVTALRIPKLSPGARWGYYKICRKPGEFADSIGAVVHDPDRGLHPRRPRRNGRRAVGRAGARRRGPGREGCRDRRRQGGARRPGRGVRRLRQPDPRRRAQPRDQGSVRVMTEISLTINGAPVTASVEPRTSLADFVRDSQRLTGTHLGCEHGVCGACTLEIDGEPMRSCITYAVSCDGASVTTIEGFDDDDVMEDLRQAFTENHGLQCGYCTPGMLVTARDIVRRLPDADEKRVRLELSGNLCRCTGYVGIVRAILAVLEKRRG